MVCVVPVFVKAPVREQFLEIDSGSELFTQGLKHHDSLDNLLEEHSSSSQVSDEETYSVDTASTAPSREEVASEGSDSVESLQDLVDDHNGIRKVSWNDNVNHFMDSCAENNERIKVLQRDKYKLERRRRKLMKQVKNGKPQDHGKVYAKVEELDVKIDNLERQIEAAEGIVRNMFQTLQDHTERRMAWV